MDAYSESQFSMLKDPRLTGRLEKLQILEIRKDGSKGYVNLSIRDLYRYVVACVTDPRTMISILNNDAEGNVTGAMQFTHQVGEAHIQRRGGQISTSDTNPDEYSHVRVSGTTRPSNIGRQVTYRERLGGHLHPRDMRRLVTPFSASNEPELIVRRHVMLLNFDPLRAIILRDRLLILVPDGADSILFNLEKQVRGATGEVENSILACDDFESPPGEPSVVNYGNGPDIQLSDTVLGAENLIDPQQKSEENVIDFDSGSQDDDDGRDDEWEEIEGLEWINLPFELKCVDAVLFIVTSMLSEEISELEKDALDCIQNVLAQDKAGLNYDDALLAIRSIKNSIRVLTSRVKGFIQSMNTILDEDEDMALMNLSRLLTHPERFIQPVPQEVLEAESDEPELLLEANLQIALTLENILDLIQGHIDTASQLVEQKLDLSRNRLLFADLVVSVLTLCIAMASLVPAFFGMNLNDHLQTDPHSFARVTYGTIGCTIFMALVFFAILYYFGAMPRISFRRSAPSGLSKKYT